MAAESEAGQWRILIIGGGLFVGVLGLAAWILAQDGTAGVADDTVAPIEVATRPMAADPGRDLPGAEAPDRTPLPAHVQRKTGFAIINKSPLRMQQEKKWAEAEAREEWTPAVEEGSEEEPPDIE